MTDLSILTDVMKGKPVGVFDPETGGLKTEYKTELASPRQWRIKVTQIPCDCRNSEDPEMKLAPSGIDLKSNNLSQITIGRCYDHTILLL